MRGRHGHYCPRSQAGYRVVPAGDRGVAIADRYSAQGHVARVGNDDVVGDHIARGGVCAP